MLKHGKTTISCVDNILGTLSRLTPQGVFEVFQDPSLLHVLITVWLGNISPSIQCASPCSCCERTAAENKEVLWIPNIPRMGTLVGTM